MLDLYVIVRLSPRLILFSLCFFILPFFLLITHHSCFLKYPSGHSCRVAVAQATLHFQVFPVYVRGPAAFLPLYTKRSVPLISHCSNPHTRTAPAGTDPFPPLPVTLREAGLGFGGPCLIAEIVIPSTRYLAALSLPAQPLNVHTFKQ